MKVGVAIMQNRTVLAAARFWVRY